MITNAEIIFCSIQIASRKRKHWIKHIYFTTRWVRSAKRKMRSFLEGNFLLFFMLFFYLSFPTVNDAVRGYMSTEFAITFFEIVYLCNFFLFSRSHVLNISYFGVIAPYTLWIMLRSTVFVSIHRRSGFDFLFVFYERYNQLIWISNAFQN